MRGSSWVLPWVAVGTLVCVMLCLRGPVPPELAIRAGGRSEPIAAVARHDAAGPTDSVPSAAVPSPTPAAVSATADAAVRLVLSGLRENRPEVLWDALPASYQRDVNDLVHLFANRLHPEAWRWLQEIAAKQARVLRMQAAAVPDEELSDGREDDASEQARASVQLADVLDRFARMGSGSLETLKNADVGAVIRAGDRQLMADLRDLVDENAAGMLQELLDVTSKLRISTKDAAGETATVVVGSSAAGGAEFEFVRVDGKWVPRQLAENWAPAVGKARTLLEQALFSDVARDNFGVTFQLLAGIELTLDEEIAMQIGRGEDNLFSEIDDALSASELVTLLGYLLGDIAPTDPDFHQKTKESLAGKDKTVVVCCNAPENVKLADRDVAHDLVRQVASRFAKKRINVVDSKRVEVWVEKNHSWTKTSQIGGAFKADYVVHLDIKDYTLFEAHSQNQYRGRADIIVNVVKMDEDKRDGNVIYTTPVKSFFPTRSPVDSNAMSYAEFKKHYLSALSDEIGMLFYAGDVWHDNSETMDEDEPKARLGGAGGFTGIRRAFGEDGDEQPGSRQESTPQEREARAITNSDVVAMVQNGVADSTICTVILVQGGQFDLSPKGIEALKRGGVSNLVIKAMQYAD